MKHIYVIIPQVLETLPPWTFNLSLQEYKSVCSFSALGVKQGAVRKLLGYPIFGSRGGWSSQRGTLMRISHHCVTTLTSSLPVISIVEALAGTKMLRDLFLLNLLRQSISSVQDVRPSCSMYRDFRGYNGRPNGY